AQVPYVRALEGTENGAVPDAVAVRFVSGVEARIEVARNLDGLEDPDGQGQSPVEGPNDRLALDGTIDRDAGDLPTRVHAGIGAASPAHRHGPTRKLGARVLEDGLDRDSRRLPLPADVL